MGKIKLLSSLTRYVVFSLAMVLLFTVVVIVLVCHNVMIPDTLITCFYAVFGGEVVFCALIKIFKLREDGISAQGVETTAWSPEEDDGK